MLKFQYKFLASSRGLCKQSAGSPIQFLILYVRVGGEKFGEHNVRTTSLQASFFLGEFPLEVRSEASSIDVTRELVRVSES